MKDEEFIKTKLNIVHRNEDGEVVEEREVEEETAIKDLVLAILDEKEVDLKNLDAEEIEDLLEGDKG